MMKLATYRDGSRDGQLVVVSRDLQSAHYATGIAHKMQQVLDDWNFLAPQLQDLYDTLNGGKARHAFPFDAAQCMAPLPRPTSGPTARRTSTTSSWCAPRAAPKCPRATTRTRSCTRAAATISSGLWNTRTSSARTGASTSRRRS